MRRPPRWLLGVAATWFALAGAASGITAVVGAWSALSAGLSGCVLLIGDAALRLPVAPDAFGCTQRVDVVPLVLGAGTSVVLLATFGWLVGAQRGRWSVPFGAAGAVFVGIQPLLLVTWLIDNGYLTGGPIELAVAVVPLTWAIASAGTALTAWRAAPA